MLAIVSSCSFDPELCISEMSFAYLKKEKYSDSAVYAIGERESKSFQNYFLRYPKEISVLKKIKCAHTHKYIVSSRGILSVITKR